MTIFYLTYWSINDGLSVSTAHPNLRILADLDKVSKIYYFSIERSEAPQFKPIALDIPKVEHIPIFSTNYTLRLLTKFADVRHIQKTLAQKAKTLRPDLIIARGAITGIFAYKLHRQTRIPYLVESFEPHADYMQQSGVWHKYGLSYQIEAYYERKIKQTAQHLVTVSHNYYKELADKENISKDRLSMVACCVQLDTFQFSEGLRQDFRTRIQARKDEYVGIYVGKFGSIYYDEEAFWLFKQLYDRLQGNFRLVLLSPTPIHELQAKLQKVNFPLAQTYITCALHTDVPGYLSAADIALSPIRPADCRRFCSPIKNGEYWACGLPILSPEGIGDDSDIIHKNPIAGAIFDLAQPDTIPKATQHLLDILANPQHREQIRQIAIQHRHFDTQKAVYQQIIR